LKQQKQFSRPNPGVPRHTFEPHASARFIFGW